MGVAIMAKPLYMNPEMSRDVQERSITGKGGRRGREA
jgi:hypothetical protein